ncbi:MAG: HEAT repeat domain-containing protein [Candidatus Kapabacteria bacterium]|jgi:HEAT repeat protein|nr:HEAT repeat domain-containing protein [Candidatus Kapabacteria bacterium]
MSVQDRISTMLTATDAAVRRRAAEEFMGLNSASGEVITAFAKGLSDEDKGVRDICALALVRLGNDATHVNARSVAQAIAPLITHEDIEVRNLAGDVLIKLGSDAVDALYPYLQDSKADNRKFACDIVGLSNNPAAIPHVRAILTDEDDNVRCAAVEALGFLKASDLLGDIIAMYDDEAVRPYVVAAIGNIGGKQAQEFLLNIMDETDEFVQIAAIDALAVCADEIGIAHKLLALLPKAGEDVQPVLLRTMYSIAFRLQVAVELPKDMRRIAQQALTDDDPDTRIAGLLALGQSYEEEDIPALLHEITQNNPETQQHILSVVLSNSAPAVAREFFDRVFAALLDANLQISELLGFLTALVPNVSGENSAIALQAVTRQYQAVIQDHRREIVEFLLAVSRDEAIRLLSDEITSGQQHRIEDATQFAEFYNIREIVLP